jgi:glycosyltransferase involved in cell wall biosynthesis
MISFIMMAKNVAEYIEESVAELQKENTIEWELIIVEDHSDDDTYSLVEVISKKDERIKLYRNPYKGKVLGTNFGYEQSSGNIIKCIDSDDILLVDFFSYIDEMQKYDAHFHSAKIVDENLKIMGTYHTNPLIISKSFEYVASNLLSVPKWSWSFKRDIAEKVFPLPGELPFEDVWMGVLIKKHARNILNINKPLYLYRQHGNQTFGGILNFSKEARIFRAKRLLKLIDILVDEQRVVSGSMLDSNSFCKIKEFNQLLSSEDIGLGKILFSRLGWSKKIKLFLYFFMPKFTVNLIKLKWMFDVR